MIKTKRWVGVVCHWGDQTDCGGSAKPLHTLQVKMHRHQHRNDDDDDNDNYHGDDDFDDDDDDNLTKGTLGV